MAPQQTEENSTATMTSIKDMGHEHRQDATTHVVTHPALSQLLGFAVGRSTVVVHTAEGVYCTT